jgi:hypothetical protein
VVSCLVMAVGRLVEDGVANERATRRQREGNEKATNEQGSNVN